MLIELKNRQIGGMEFTLDSHPGVNRVVPHYYDIGPWVKEIMVWKTLNQCTLWDMYAKCSIKMRIEKC